MNSHIFRVFLQWNTIFILLITVHGMFRNIASYAHYYVQRTARNGKIISILWKVGVYSRKEWLFSSLSASRWIVISSLNVTVDVKQMMSLGHRVCNFVKSGIPSKCLFSNHRIVALRKDFIGVVQLFTFILFVVLQMKSVNNLLNISPHCVQRWWKRQIFLWCF